MCLKCCLQPWLESYFLRQFSVSCVQQLQSFLSCQIRLTESPHLYRKMPLDFKIEFAVLTPSTQWQWTRFSELKCFSLLQEHVIEGDLASSTKTGRGVRNTAPMSLHQHGYFVEMEAKKVTSMTPIWSLIFAWHGFASTASFIYVF